MEVKKIRKLIKKKFLILKRKPVYLTIIGIFIILVLFFGTNLFLTLNLLIKDESFVRVTVSNQDLFLNNSENSEVEFNAYISSNPFCESSCEYKLMDLSTGEAFDEGSFKTTISNPYSKKYDLFAPEKGTGQILYRFSINCLSKQSNFCKSNEREIKGSSIVSLNYNLSLEKANLREESFNQINKMINDSIGLNLLSLENKYLNLILSNKILIREIEEMNLSLLVFQINQSIQNFRNYNYEISSNNSLEFFNKSINFENNFLNERFESYNSLVFLIKEEEDKIVELSLMGNLTGEEIQRISEIIKDHNEFVKDLNYLFDLDVKTIELGQLISAINEFDSGLEKISETNTIFEEINFSQIEQLINNFNESYQSNLFVELEKPICSYGGIYKECCDDFCSNDSSKYPIILIHGHSFNSAISADKSLGDLRELQEKLFLEGFLDGGDLILKSESEFGTFRQTREQVVFSASYYFDIYKNTEETILLETMSDDLDTYSLRLNEIINEAKLKTGKDKVFIVTHSMGGLVARKYLQIFGEEDVEKLIMVGSPNHGIDGRILTGCSVLGTKKHCEDMDEESLFLNKLNYGKQPNIPVENIIGTGCDMQGENGDGLVKNSSAYLSWANNYYVNGTCEGFNFLHNNLAKPNKYPEVYDLIKKLISLN